MYQLYTTLLLGFRCNDAPDIRCQVNPGDFRWPNGGRVSAQCSSDNNDDSDKKTQKIIERIGSASI